MNPKYLLVTTMTLLLLWQCKPAPDKSAQNQEEFKRPNILIAISDDQSYPYASAYGNTSVNTPAFDRVAHDGVLFTNGFVASPGCSPSRAAFLTGRYPWQIEEAGTHGSSFPAKYVVFPDMLESAGYFIGATGKKWAPGDFKISKRKRNPVGPSFDKKKLKPPHNFINNNDYAANFADFLAQRPKDQPFYFWYGATEPHRPFEEGIGTAAGKDLSEAFVPSFLPEHEVVQSDILDYAIEVEWFDQHLAKMLQMLEEAGELDNTIIIVTSDNGMAFPRAKANLYEYGFHVPLAISWPQAVPSGRTIEDPVSLVDLTKTILEATETPITAEYPLSGTNILPWLQSEESGVMDQEKVVYAGRERHSSSRWNNYTYPQRAIRTHQYLYIRNFKPERWPAGAPQKFDKEGKLEPMHSGYHDIDAAASLSFLTENFDNDTIAQYFHWAVDHRPAVELYDIEKDPGCLYNLAQAPEMAEVKENLGKQLVKYLTETEDPRVMGNGDIWEEYPRLKGTIRKFPEPDWVKENN